MPFNRTRLKKRKKEISGPFPCSFPHRQAQLVKRWPDGYSVFPQFNNYMSFTGREVRVGKKTVPLVLSTAPG